MARPFPAIGGAIQGEIKGERERRERGLIPPNQFGNPMLDSRGFGGGLVLGFTGEREAGRQLEEEGDGGLARGPHAGRALSARATHVRGREGRLGRGAARVGPGGRPRRRGGGGGLGRGEGEPKRREREKERERKRGRREGLRPRAERERGGLWARFGPKEKGGLFLDFLFK
uniref:BKRF1 encodes EBNA-1 protein-like n=1 Tax=Oryza nivara TaxID=4536 RepID=A0A679BDE1_ORYNI|nr:BKRF1 encodes EBNA-1 protein -like [Oryza sativa f. spontanea]